MSDEELRVVNAFIGFCTPSGNTWPCPFEHGKYEITGLEHPVQVTIDGQVKSPTPELVATSAQQQHCVLLEAKSGSVNDGQARGYEAVTPGHLISQALASSDMQAANSHVDVLYFTSERNLDRLLADFGRTQFSFPVISYGDARFELRDGSIDDELMHGVFESGIAIDPADWPSHFVRCDRDSTPGQLAPVIMGKVAQLAISGREIRAAEICGSSVEFWDRRGQLDRTHIANNVVSLIDDAVRTELAQFVERGGGRGVWMRKSTGPWKSMTLDRFSDAIEAFIRRKQSGEDYVPGQTTLGLSVPKDN